MKRLHFRALQVAVAGLLIAGWTPVLGDPADDAAFHLNMIAEVFPGTVAKPNAQYVVLQAYFGGQNFVAGHKVYFFNAAGAKIDSATLMANVANSADQMKIMISTPQAETLFSIANDFDMPAAINPSGGKVCFDGSNIDCVSWGNYTGSPVGVGTPFSATLGLLPCQAAKRRLDVAAPANHLDAADDTQDSKNDFRSGPPAPKNNVGGTGVTPPSTCANNIIEGLEQCDDGNTSSGDGCDSLCQSEVVCPVTQTGDVNISGAITSADIIYMVNHVFKGGVAPLPCAAAGDVNCNGANTSADIIFLVNHVFKGGAPPCDVCTLVPGTWSCP